VAAGLRFSRGQTLRDYRRQQGIARGLQEFRRFLRRGTAGSFVRHSRATVPEPSLQRRLPLRSMYKLGDGNWNNRRQKAVAYLKAKKAEYTNSLHDSDEEISSPYRDPSRLNEPFKDEQLIIYPSYCCRLSDGRYDVEVRGWLYSPGEDNRKSRLLHTLAKQLSKSSTQLPAGSEFSTQEQTLITLLGESEGKRTPEIDTNSKCPSLAKRQSSFSSYSSDEYSRSADDQVLKYRVSGFLAKPAPDRRLSVLVGAEQTLVNHDSLDKTVDQLMKVDVITNSSGRFTTRIRVPYKPSFVHVVASDEVSSVDDIIDIDSEGVSVITDIDDTIRHTGVTGDKRTMFRNVFVRDYNEVFIDGVSHWYKVMESMGVKFHYVSNSPWQIINIITEYLSQAGLPRGSIHLKHYSGFLTGLLEPAVEKKKPTLQAILRDFPHRSFILVGDSGERDLEAYVDLAREFPKQVVAIYIRDITLPPDDKTLLTANQDLLSGPISGVSGRPIQDDFYLTNYVRTTKSTPIFARSTSSLSVQNSSLPSITSFGSSREKIEGNNTAASRSGSLTSTGDLIDLSDNGYDSGRNEHPSKSSAARKPAPPVPSKPNYLRNARHASPLSTPPPLPARPRDSEPVVMPSSQNDAGIYDILDKKVENWKTRVVRAREQLPPGVKLRMWRQGYDMEHECILKVKEALRATS
jgi:phosphatidate phosphatase APP1